MRTSALRPSTAGIVDTARYSRSPVCITNALPLVKLIAAGEGHTVAALVSPLVQYPVDVTKDLLLIYNTNSLDSSNVWSYYMQHRPMVSNASAWPRRTVAW